MPPMWNWYVGTEAYRGFMERVFRTRGSTWRMVPIAANGQPAVAAYALGDSGSYELHSLHVFTVEAGRISRTTVFQDHAVFGLFEIPPILPRRDESEAPHR
jgi:RNA polymerase sigma-70 factor (ECF subfamily)